MSTPTAADDIDPHLPEYASPEADASGGDESDSGFMSGLFAATDGTPEEPTENIEDPAGEPPEVDDPLHLEDDPKVDPEAPAEIDPKTDPDFADAPDFKKKENIIGWKELKTRKATAERERDEARSELEKLRKSPATPANSEEALRLKAELDDHKKQLAEYDSRIALLDVERSKEYQTTIGEPLARAESLIQSFASKYSIEVSDIAKAATEPDVLERNQLLSELVGGMNDFDKFEFKKVVDDARTLYERSVQVKANAKQSQKFLEEARAREAGEQQQQTAAQAQKAADQIWGGLRERMAFLKEDTKLAAQLDADARGADLLSAPPDTQAYAKYAAVVLPTLMEKYEAQAKELAAMKQSIAKRNAALPSARGGSIAGAPATAGDDFMGGLDALLGTAGRG